MTLVDTNVLIDVVAKDSPWLFWSLARLDEAAANGPLLINDVVYAELSVSYSSVKLLDEVLESVDIGVAATPKPALFLAGKAYKRYRAAGGVRTGVLPDFFIGAHAAVSGLALITRDPRRYRTYFPTIDLIAP